MDESAEEVAAASAIGRVWRRRVAAVGRLQLQRAVRPVRVVVAAVDAQDMLEVAAAEDLYTSLDCVTNLAEGKPKTGTRSHAHSGRRRH